MRPPGVARKTSSSVTIVLASPPPIRRIMLRRNRPASPGRETSMAALIFDSGALLSGLMRLQLGNLNALAEAQRSALEGLAALGRQPPRLPTLAMPISGDPRSAIAAPIEALKAAMLDGTAQANAMLEITARANAEAAGILQERAIAALDEWKALLLAATNRRGG